MKRYFSRSCGDTKKKKKNISPTRAWHRVSRCGSNLSPLLAPPAASHPPLAHPFFLVDDVPRLNRLTTDRDARARISDSFDFSDGSSGGMERASAREREEGRWCHRIESFLGIGCQIESGGTSAPYHSTRRRVCRMFNDGRGRFRVSETGPPNPRHVSAQPRYSKAEMPVLVCVTTRRIKRHGGSVIYNDAHENSWHASTLIFLHDVVGNEHLSHERMYLNASWAL